MGIPITASDISWRRLLWYVLPESRGPRRRIINLLHKQPYIVNRLAGAPNIHNRVAEHHTQALKKNPLVSSASERYSKPYFLQPELEAIYKDGD